MLSKITTSYIFFLKNAGTSKSSVSCCGVFGVLLVTLESVTGFLPNGLLFIPGLDSGI
ncbi:MAG: hypothetical protein LBC61_06220 [Candidatus Peribacteria bacterium]|nr:hypothetical protein [Candidatus Peribacteria bacterium]